ncbi:hypothetical protein N9Z14_00830 [Opitutales bacterium]|nr:hypothetical protein [Opitutales bacterium]
MSQSVVEGLCPCGAQANLSGSLDFGPPQATTPRENFRNDSLAACFDE